jgi:hypothetical protein
LQRRGWFVLTSLTTMSRADADIGCSGNELHGRAQCDQRPFASLYEHAR